jgi:hypothetical protein
MADITIDPRIPLGVNPPKTITLPEMLNLARGAEEFRQAQQVNPLLLQQQQAQTGMARTQEMAATENLSKSRADRVFGIVGGFMNDPRVMSGDPQKTVDMMLEIKRKAISSGVPEAQVEAILAPITATAAHNAQALPQMITNVIQSQLGAQGQQGLQTPELTSQAGAPAAFRRGPGTLTPVPTLGAPQPPAVAPAPQGVTPDMMTAPITPQAAQTTATMPRPQAVPTDPGYQLRFPPRPIGDIRPPAAGEEAAATAGNAYLTNMMTAQGEVPKAIRNVSEVIRGAEELEKTVNFQTGKPADIERAVRTFFGEDQYKQLSKDIANAQIALMRSTGGDLTTDAGKALVARATGDETYPPQVLLSIARRLNGELTKVDMEARGAQRAATLFGNANLPAFQQAWNSNADLRVFEAISIVNNIRDPKKQKSALDKILPNNAEELADFQQKYRNIKKLTETGTLR